LSSITIPENVSFIGEHVFEECGKLFSIKVEEGNKRYDSRNNCNAIVETATNSILAGCSGTTIPNSITSIGAYSFYSCWGLTSIDIPNSVTSIGINTFAHCSGLTSITIPNSVTSIGYSAFDFCTNLSSVTIHCATVGNWFFNSNIKDVVLGDEVISIDDYAFNNCKTITSITIPNSVTSIGQSSFLQCDGLTSVTIGKGVTSIGRFAFNYCNGLTAIHCKSEIPPTIENGWWVFDGDILSSATLYVPQGTIDAYKSANEWSKFQNIVEE
jgi:hypothetical protein